MSQITTHVLDTASGTPAAGLSITLYRHDDGTWHELASGVTDEDGRMPDVLPDGPLPAGTYRMHFATGAYFSAMDVKGFYPWADVVFELDAGGEHYHVPLLLAPYGYSTYRGS